ncbi:MAG: FGGY-family carbohydrate kinase [Anaerolineae bacterium]
MRKRRRCFNSEAVIGSVTEQAAAETGLRAGTPVVSGMHDVDACAIGTGCAGGGRLSMTAGTFSINQVVSENPVIDERWACRSFVRQGAWMNMSISPASATNLDWLLETFCKAEIEAARQSGQSLYAFVNHEIESILHEDSNVFFLPFIFGRHMAIKPAPRFPGLRGWHGRAHVLRAVFEGVAFNHRTIDALRSAFPVNEVRVSGGGSRSLIWTQLFADVFGLPVVITDAAEAGALGAAICAGLGVRVYETVDDAIARTVRATRVHVPDVARQQKYELAYQTYNALIDALKPVWSSVEGRLVDQSLLPN